MNLASKFFSVLAVLLLVSYSNAHASTCPTTASTNTDCAFILTIGSGGTVTGSVVAGANAYDGSDDALVGVVNNSGSAYTGSIPLSGSGNGGGIFAFEGDGICSGTYGAFPGCSTTDSTGYGADGITFSSISLDKVSGDVNIANLAAGGTAFFSLESSPSSITSGGGGIVVGGGGGAAPEPSSMILMATGLLGMGGAIRRKLLA